MNRPSPTPEERKALIEQTRDEREREYAAIGDLAPLVRVRSVSAELREQAPRWPATTLPPLRAIRRDGRVLLITDGLSDPFDLEIHGEDGGELGLECEIFVETTEAIALTDENAPRHWLEWVLWSLGDAAAEAGTLADAVTRFGAITVQIPSCEELEPFALPTGFVPVLLGQRAPGVGFGISLPSGSASLIAAKVIWPDEHAHAVAMGDEGGIDLARRFARRGDHHLSMLDRPSVLVEPDWRCPANADLDDSTMLSLPGDLETVDAREKIVNGSVVVVGSGYRRYLGEVYRSISGQAVPLPDQGSLLYVPLRLGEVRGWKTMVHCYGTDDEGAARRLLARAHACVVVQDDDAPEPSTEIALEHAARRPEMHLAVLAPKALRRTIGDRTLAYGAACEGHEVMPALKAITAAILGALRDPTSAPTPSEPAPRKPWWKIW